MNPTDFTPFFTMCLRSAPAIRSSFCVVLNTQRFLASSGSTTDDVPTVAMTGTLASAMTSRIANAFGVVDRFTNEKETGYAGGRHRPGGKAARIDAAERHLGLVVAQGPRRQDLPTMQTRGDAAQPAVAERLDRPRSLVRRAPLLRKSL